MLLRYPRSLYAGVAVVMTAAYVVLAFVLGDMVLESFNGISILPWAFVSFLGGLTAGVTAFLVLKRVKSDKNAISHTTPRSKLGIGIADFLVRYFTVALLPFCLVFFGAVLTQTIVHHRGLLLLGVVPSSLLFLAAMALIGEIIALLVDLEILAVLVSFVVGTILSLYATSLHASVSNWETVNPAAFIFAAICFAIALAGKCVGDWLRITTHVTLSRLIQGVVLVVFFAVFYSLSSSSSD